MSRVRGFVQPPQPVALSGPPTFSNALAYGGQPNPYGAQVDRPFADAGKFQLDLLATPGQLPNQPPPNETGGFLAGLFGAIGQTFGEGGRQIGTDLGKIIEAPIGFGGEVLGKIGSIPLPLGTEIGTAIFGKGEEGQPRTGLFADFAQTWTKKDVNIGDVFMTALGGLGLLGRGVERIYAGSDARGSMPADLEAAVAAGQITRDEALDQLVLRGQGYTNDPYANIAWSVMLDPLTWLSLGVGGVAKASAATAKLSKAAEISGMVERGTQLAPNVARLMYHSGQISDPAMAAAQVGRLGRGERLALNTVGRLPGFNEALVPIANQVIRATDPLRIFSGGDIGRRTAQVVSTSATAGVMTAYKLPVVERVGKSLNVATTGGRNKLNRALGILTTNYLHEYILRDTASDAIRAGRVPSIIDEGRLLRPTEVAEGIRGRNALDASVGRDLEVVAERLKPDATEFANEAAMDLDTQRRLAWVAGSSVDSIKGLKGGYDEYALAHAATYAEAGRQLIDEVRPAVKGKLPVDLGDAEQFTIAAKTTLTDKRWALVREAIEKEDGVAVRAAVARYKELNFVNEAGIDATRNAELFDALRRWGETNADGLVKELPLHDAAGVLRGDLPAELSRWVDEVDQFGYTLTQAPQATEEALWRIARDSEGRIIDMRPWNDFVTEAQAVKNPGMMARVRSQMFRQIRTERILWSNRRRFVQLLSRDAKVSPDLADRIYKNVMYAASERGIMPRGLRPTEIMDAARKALKTEHQRGAVGLGALNETVLTKQLLVAFEGDLSLVGVTQKLTGKAKRRLPGAGENQWGQIAEKLYPMARFTLNHFFMVQEFFEPYILNKMRGAPLPLRRHAEGFENAVAFRNAMNNLVRSDFTPDGVMLEMAEYQRVVQAGVEQAHTHLGPGSAVGRAVGRIRPKGIWGGIADRKTAAEGMLARKIIGERMRTAFNQIRGPEYWSELERAFGTTDPGMIAERWLRSSFAVADKGGEFLTSASDILKPSMLGAETRIFTGSGPGVRWHHVAEVLGRTGENADEELLRALKLGHTDPTHVDALTRADFVTAATKEGIDQSFAERAYKMATGPEPDEFWKGFRNVMSASAKAAEKDATVRAARTLVTVRARVMGLTEDEFIKLKFAAPPGLTTEQALRGSTALFDARAGLTRSVRERLGTSPEDVARALDLETVPKVRSASAARVGSFFRGETVNDVAREMGTESLTLPIPRVNARFENGQWTFPEGTPQGSRRLVTGPDGEPMTAEMVAPMGMSQVEVPGTRQPLDFVFRAVSDEDWEDIQRVGFMKSDGRMNLDPSEGTVASHRNPSWYLPGALASDAVGDHPGRILKIRVDSADGWKVAKADEYIKTPGSIPLDRIEASPRIISTKDATGGVERRVEAGPVRRVMAELPDDVANENLFQYVALHDPDAMRVALPSLAPRDQRVVEAALAKGDRLRARPRHVFTSANGQKFVTGNVTPDDLVQMAVDWMDEGEGIAAKAWYTDIREGIRRVFGDSADDVIRMFGVSQANDSPVNGLMMVLRALEQGFSEGFEVGTRKLSISGGARMGELRKFVQPKMRGGKSLQLNAENIARALLDQPINANFGAKLNDFVDSLVGNDSRRWVGRDRKGLAPVAVDRHTARDVGFMDNKVITRLAELPSTRVLANDVHEIIDDAGAVVMRVKPQRNRAKIGDWHLVDDQGRFVDEAGTLVEKPVSATEFTDAPAADLYEWGVRSINEAAAKFNSHVDPVTGVQGVWGRTDWTASEVQAVGWMRVQKTLGGAEESPLVTFERNTQSVLAEVSAERGSDWERFRLLSQQLDLDQTARVSSDVNVAVAQAIRDELGVTSVVTDWAAPSRWRGGGESISAPSLWLSTPESGDDIADIVAMAYRQRAVLHPKAISASRFDPAIHRPVLDITHPGVGDDATQVKELTRLAEALNPGGASVIRDGNGRLRLRIIDMDESPFIPRGARGLPDQEALDAKLQGAFNETGLSYDDFDAQHWLADVYEAGPYRQMQDAGIDRLDDLLGPEGSIQRAYDAGDTTLGQRLQREAEDLKGAEKTIWENHRAVATDALRGRGRAVDEGSISRIRDAATTAYSDALRRELPEQWSQFSRGDSFLHDARDGGVLGFTQRLDDDRVIIGATRRADPVTALHELTHVFATDLDDSARALVQRTRLTYLAENRTDLTARITAAEAKAAAAKSARTRQRYNAQASALRHDLGELADEGKWGVQHEEWFVDEFQRWMKTGRPPHRELQGVFEHFRNWLTTIWQGLRGSKAVRDEAHPEMVKLFEGMFSDRVPSVPYDLDQHALMTAAKQVVRQGMDEAQTTQYFKKGRSFFERSLNHPFVGLYPVSYYWGKIIPEMVRFLALRPMGMQTPFLAWNALREVSDTVRMQQAIDPNVKEYLEKNEDFFMTLNMLFPAVPNDIPVNSPLWARRISEQGLENADRVSKGQEARPIDFMAGLADSAKWVFGPYASLERLGSTLGWAGDTGREVLGIEKIGTTTKAPARTTPLILDPLTGKPLN